MCYFFYFGKTFVGYNESSIFETPTSQNFCNMKHLFLFIFTLPVLFCCQLTAQDFEVAPVKISFSADPGESQSILLSVTNHAAKPSSFTLTVADYEVDSEGNRLETDTRLVEDNAISKILTVNPAFFTLNPGEQKAITLTVLVPNEDFFTRWGTLYVSTASERTASDVGKVNTGVLISPRIGVALSHSPRSNANHKARIRDLVEITSDADSSRVFTAVIDNYGEKITDCKVFFVASSLQTGDEQHFPAVNYQVYPNRSRFVELRLPKAMAPGRYSLAAIIDYGNRATLSGTQILIDVP